MAFDPNREMKIEAAETAAGMYVLRTRGLADKGRAELEIAGVPEVALNAAGGVINMIAGYTVNKAEVLADQNVGNVLAVGDEGRKLLLVVSTVTAEKPKGGLWSKIAGGGSKGVLRLVDVSKGEGDAPLTARATMLVHRAGGRLAQDDAEGARSELAAAIAILPGERDAGAAPEIASAGTFNWQNHLAYLELAKLAGDQMDDAALHFGEALARSPELARAQLGATVSEVMALTTEDIAREAARIIAHNASHVERGPGPTNALVTLGSPIWEVDAEGRACRRASLLPAALVGLYYEGVAAERLARDGAALVTKILARDADRPWRAVWIARDTRDIWISEEAPLLAPIGAAHPAQGIVSCVLADLARLFRAGATDEEILVRYAAPSLTGPELDSLSAKMADQERWEGEQYVAAMSP